MNKLPTEKRAQALQMMAEGISLRAMTRLTGISRTTLLKLLEDAGQAFSEYMDRTLVNLPCKRLWALSPLAAFPSRVNFRIRPLKGIFDLNGLRRDTLLCHA